MRSHVFAFLFALSAMVVSTPAHADCRPDGNPLACVMDQMKGDFRALVAQTSDPAKNGDSAQKAFDLSEHIRAALGLVPDKVAALPEAERAIQRIEFRKLLTQLYSQALELERAMRENRNGDARPILQEMDRIRKQGHDTFDDGR